ncbi:phosphate signaling complex protein PhoU [Balneolaceae bacterium ANBcel3]|nr:phosphate signaling complex protein PhoU [Balneolaceae bacterium ANBcel3]
MREAFENHLKSLEKDLVEMSEMVISAIEKSVDALKNGDVEHAKIIKKDDYYINKKRWDIEEKCINLIATQQPVAVHLRELIAILNIITDLERMGDYAEGIAKIVLKINGDPLIKPLIDIPRMQEISIEMIRESLIAFSARDEQAARLVNAKDDSVDELYHQVTRELISIMIENPRTITQCTHLMWASHNLERIADRVTNICERIIFLVTGEMVENIKN